MKTHWSALIALLTGACGVFGAEPGGEGEGQAGAWVRSGGVERTYYLRLPSAYDPGRNWPLLVVFHGVDDVGRDFEPRAGLAPLTEAAGVIAVYPDGLGGSWASGCDCTAADAAGVDDVRFVRTLLGHLTRHFAVDPRRVYVAGYSQGGMLVQRLACDLADRLAGAASVAATLPRNIADRCKPSRPVPMLFFQGTADPVFAWEGMKPARQAFYSMPKTVQFFADKGGCVGPPATTAAGENPIEDETTVEIAQYQHCGGSVTLYEIDGGGHTWPNGPGPWPEALGRVSHDIDAGVEILKLMGMGTVGLVP